MIKQEERFSDMTYEDAYERIVRKIESGLEIHETWQEGNIRYTIRSTITSMIHVALLLTDDADGLIGVATGTMGRREFARLGPVGFSGYLAWKKGELSE